LVEKTERVTYKHLEIEFRDGIERARSQVGGSGERGKRSPLTKEYDELVGTSPNVAERRRTSPNVVDRVVEIGRAVRRARARPRPAPRQLAVRADRGSHFKAIGSSHTPCA